MCCPVLRTVRRRKSISSDLIGDIYDSAPDPSLWIRVLAKCAEFVGGSAASLYSKDVACKTANPAYQYGLDPGYLQLYLQTYVKLDPKSRSTPFGYVCRRCSPCCRHNTSGSRHMRWRFAECR